MGVREAGSSQTGLKAGQRLIAVAIAVCVFYSPIWLPLQRLTRDLIGLWLSAVGSNPRWCEHEGYPALQLGGRRYHFTPDCTYMDLVLLLCVLLWSRQLSTPRNLSRLAVVTAALLIFNFVRASVALALNADGVSWLWCHEAPDFVFYWPVLAAAALKAAKDDGLSFPVLTRVRPADSLSRGSAC